MLFFGVFLRESARTAAKSRTNLSTNSEKATKRLGRLAPNLANVQIHMRNKLPFETQRGYLEGFMGSNIGKSGKLSNGWTDWHQLWFTSADSSGNGLRLNTSRPSITQGAFLGGFRGSQTKKSLGKLSNGLTDWHQLWFTSADSSGNGNRLNTSRPTITRGISFFFRG